MIYVALSSLAVAFIAIVMYVRLRRRVNRALKQEISVRVLPKVMEEMKEMTYRRFALLHNIYGMLLYTCNNSPKQINELAEYLVEEYKEGRISSLSNDIVYSLNLCEGGALFRMAQEYRLTDIELRTCCYIHVGFKWQQTCTAENITENAYNVRCSRIRKKLRMEREERIPEFIEDYCRAHANFSGL